MIIDSITVRLEPWRFRDTREVELRISVRTMGQEYHVSRILVDNDREALIDRYFEDALYEVKAALKKQEEAQKAVTP